CGASADDAEPETRDFGPVTGRLTIAKDNGDLTVRPADVGEVRVTRRFDRWSVIGGRPTATWELRGNRLTLATDCGTFIGGCEVRYEVVVPQDLALDVQGQNGRITVTGASGPLSLKTENGTLHANGTRSGRVDATSENGEVDLAFAAVPDQVDVTTDNGAVTIAVPDAAYRVTTASDNGDVSAALPSDDRSTRRINVRTANGSITLRTADSG
ncbi:DUF4097 family beta strand repeat-containing protein, partial [Actinomadura adrarensis]